MFERKSLSRRELFGLSGVLIFVAYYLSRSRVGVLDSVAKDESPAEKAKRVLKAWSLTPELSYTKVGVADGASQDTLNLVQGRLGLLLPESMHAIYLGVDGGEFIGGNIQLDPIAPQSGRPMSVATNRGQLRAWHWPVPDELLIFGGDGGDSVYGLWMDPTRSGEPLVVEMLGASDMFQVVGDDLGRFLQGRTAYYLMLYETDGYAIDDGLNALGLPPSMRLNDAFDDAQYLSLQNWANPGLARLSPDRERWLTAMELRELIKSDKAD